MYSTEVYNSVQSYKLDLSISELIGRVQPGKRAAWTDLYNGPGVYIVYHSQPGLIRFNTHAGKASTIVTDRELLEAKWNEIIKVNDTDIIYIGKGVNVRKRIRALIRFGLGKSSKHSGGEWLWQVEGYRDLRIVISPCPSGKDAAYEKYLLQKFHDDHLDWPLANREAGKGDDIWIPIDIL